MTIIRSTDRDTYRRDEGSGRFYYFRSEGPFISVTNAIKLGIPSPYIAPWYAKVVAEKSRERWREERSIREQLRGVAIAGFPPPDDSGTTSDEDIIKELKREPIIQRDAAGDFGTTVHEICEDIILGVPVLAIPGSTDQLVKIRVNQFLNFQKTMKPTYIAV